MTCSAKAIIVFWRDILPITSNFSISVPKILVATDAMVFCLVCFSTNYKQIKLSFYKLNVLFGKRLTQTFSFGAYSSKILLNTLYFKYFQSLLFKLVHSYGITLGTILWLVWTSLITSDNCITGLTILMTQRCSEL